MINKVLLEKLFKMNGLSSTGVVINEYEKMADVLSNFGLNPSKSHDDGGEAPMAGVSNGNTDTELTEDNINNFELIENK